MENKKPKVIVCMIVKNESECLEKCLNSVKGADALYISDTGSEDNTIEIAKKYTDKVWTDYKWNDNFAEARNFILNKAKEDLKDENVYIVSIDADEYCHDFSKVREAVERAEKEGHISIDVKMYSERDNQMHCFPRLFKMCKEVWWEGAVHNHVSAKATMTSDVEITYGYSPAHLKDPNRAMRILTKEVERTGNARETFYLGREYWYRQQYKDCVDVMNRYIPNSKFLAEKADAYLILSRCYWAMGMGGEARDNCLKAIEINPNFKEAVAFMATLAGKGTGDPIWERNGDWWERASLLSNNSGVLFVR